MKKIVGLHVYGMLFARVAGDQVVGFIAFAYALRHIAVTEFGIFVIVSSIAELLRLMSMSGIIDFVTKKAKVTVRELFVSATIICIPIFIVFTAICIVLFNVDFIDYPTYIASLGLGLSIPMATYSAIYIGISQRFGRFNALTFIFVFSNITSNIVMIAIIIYSESAIALYIQKFLYDVPVFVVTVFVLFGRSNAKISMKRVLSVVAFSSRASAIHFFGTASARAQEIVAGIAIGAEVAGILRIAVRSNTMILNLVVWPLSASMLHFIGNSRVDERGSKIESYFILMAMLSIPSAFGLSLVSENYTVLIFSDQWHIAASAVSILAFALPFSAAIVVCGQFLAVESRQLPSLFVNMFLFSAITLSALIIGDVERIAFLNIVAGMIGSSVLVYYVNKTFGVSLHYTVIKFVMYSIVMSIFVSLIDLKGVIWLELGIQILTGIAVYGVLVIIFSRDDIRMMRKYIG